MGGPPAAWLVVLIFGVAEADRGLSSPPLSWGRGAVS